MDSYSSILNEEKNNNRSDVSHSDLKKGKIFHCM